MWVDGGCFDCVAFVIFTVWLTVLFVGWVCYCCFVCAYFVGVGDGCCVCCVLFRLCVFIVMISIVGFGLGLVLCLGLMVGVYCGGFAVLLFWVVWFSVWLFCRCCFAAVVVAMIWLVFVDGVVVLGGLFVLGCCG